MRQDRVMGGEGGRGPGPDESVSGQPYSAPTQAWSGNADPHNLSYDGARYFGPGYQQPNDVPWDGRPPQSYLPPPNDEERIHVMDERRFRFHMKMAALVGTAKHLREHHGYTTVPDTKRELHIAHAAAHGRDWSAHRAPEVSP